jgi:hypothetical protein
MAALLLTGCGAVSTQAVSTQITSSNCSPQQQASQNYYNTLVAQDTQFEIAISTAWSDAPTSMEVAQGDDYNAMTAAEVALEASAQQYLDALPADSFSPTTALHWDNDGLRSDLSAMAASGIGVMSDVTDRADYTSLGYYDSDLASAESDALANSGACS